MTPTLTPREKELARQVLGLDGGEIPRFMRGFASVNRKSKGDLAVWRRMARNGLAIHHCQGLDTFGFRLTRAGALAALEDGETIDEGGGEMTTPRPELIYERGACPRCGATTEDDGGEKCMPSRDETGEAYCPGETVDDDGYLLFPTKESLAAEAAWYDARIPEDER